MTDIPADIMKAAKVARHRAFLANNVDDEHDIIARAIMAERERIASLANSIGRKMERSAKAAPDMLQCASYKAVALAFAQFASAIRSERAGE